jgi:hypothetical protein
VPRAPAFTPICLSIHCCIGEQRRAQRMSSSSIPRDEIASAIAARENAIVPRHALPPRASV